MSIQRWEMLPEAMRRHPEGGMVLYSDHVAAMEAAIIEMRDAALAAVAKQQAEWEANGPYFTSVVHDCCVEKQTAREQAIHACWEVVREFGDRNVISAFATRFPEVTDEAV